MKQNIFSIDKGVLQAFQAPSLALASVHFNQLIHGRGILGLFILLSKCDEPWKA